MLPPGDEGAGEVWARPQSEDVRGHCERGRRGGGRGALPGALLWLERQVRQDLGRNHLTFIFTLKKKERKKKETSLNLRFSLRDHRYMGIPYRYIPSSQFCFTCSSLMVSTLIMENTGPSSGRNRIEYWVDVDHFLSFPHSVLCESPVCLSPSCLSLCKTNRQA